MSEDSERADSWYEVQVDRETIVLLGLGLLALLVLAFFLGRWTAPEGQAELAREEVLDPFAEDASELDAALLASGEVEPVDGEPLFGGHSVSVDGAPPLGEVPLEALLEAPLLPGATSEPEPRRSPAAGTAGAAAGTVSGWVVQVAAVKSAADARALETRLRAKGFPVRVLREGSLSKVQVGPFEGREEAQEAERRLKREEKLTTWVKRS